MNPDAESDRGGSILRRFASNLLAVAWVGAIAAACLAALGLLIAFLVGLADRHSYNYDARPPIHWWMLPAAAGAVVLAVGLYSLIAPDDEPDYCPNCGCPSCKEIRAQREREDVMSAAMVGGVAGGMLGGQAGGN